MYRCHSLEADGIKVPLPVTQRTFRNLDERVRVRCVARNLEFGVLLLKHPNQAVDGQQKQAFSACSL